MRLRIGDIGGLEGALSRSEGAGFPTSRGFQMLDGFAVLEQFISQRGARVADLVKQRLRLQALGKRLRIFSVEIDVAGFLDQLLDPLRAALGSKRILDRLVARDDLGPTMPAQAEDDKALAGEGDGFVERFFVPFLCLAQ